MNPMEYTESVKARLSSDSIVARFEVAREFANLNEGFIRVRITLTNGDILDSSEFIKSESQEIVSYRHQWMDKDKNLIRRWDNALHYPNLKNFPHHIHISNGAIEDVTPGIPTNIFTILDEIAKIIGQE